MKKFLLALQFLTIVPVKIKNIREGDMPGSAIYFPLVGLILGLILRGVNKGILILGSEQFIANTILVLALILFTGGLHLDGLADTTDAFLSRKNKDEMLKVMRDSHIGVMGVLSLIAVILLKIAFLSSLSISFKAASLLLMCILSRWSMVFAMFLFPYARQEGKAKVFMHGINLRIFTLSTIIALACVISVWQTKGVLVFMVIAAASYIAGKFITYKIGGITGDTLGALSESNEIIVLLTIIMLIRFYV